MAGSPLGRPLFTLALLADTHVNETEDGSASPYACNRKANARARGAVERIRELKPDLAIHLGDLVHPVPGQPAQEAAFGRFDEIARGLPCPLRLLAGNHDVGDKPLSWSPAPIVTSEAVRRWNDRYGPSFHALDLEGVGLLSLNAELLGSGLPEEAEQRRSIEREAAAREGRRMLWFIHYPPFLLEPDEEEHYDNLGEPGRGWLLGLLRRFRPEALFCAHVHNFWHNAFGATDLYCLPSTAFVRQDYSEMFRVEPAAERGRDDTGKLGFFLVRVHERGHLCRRVPTEGAAPGPGTPPRAAHRLLPIHPLDNPRAPLGVDLRQPWAEIVEIPPSGALDEFARKRVRNDYPLLALLDLGVQRLRAPLRDLLDPCLRERVALMGRLGFSFTAFAFGVPADAALDGLAAAGPAVEAFEIACDPAGAREAAPAIRAARARAGVPLFLSPLRPPERAGGGRYRHAIVHGFEPGEGGAAAEFLDRLGADRAGAEGVVFRVPLRTAAWEGIESAGAQASSLGIQAVVHLRLAADALADESVSDAANGARVAEGLAAALLHAGEGRPLRAVFLDTFADHDRGYFVRSGLADRRWNLRAPGRVLAHLHAALAEAGPFTNGWAREVPGARALALEAAAGRAVLVLPGGGGRAIRLPADLPGEAAGSSGTARLIALEEGTPCAVRWTRGPEDLLIDPAPPLGPSLLSFAPPSP